MGASRTVALTRELFLADAFRTVPSDETGPDSSLIGALKKPAAKQYVEYGEPPAVKQPAS
jgi:hypothetical protein